MLAGLQAARSGWREALLVPLAIACVHFGYGAACCGGRTMAGEPRVPKGRKENPEWQYVMEPPRH